MISKVNNIFHLCGRDISYIIEISETGEAVHSYFGKKIRVNDSFSGNYNLGGRAFSPKIHGNTFNMDAQVGEYTSYGHCDLHYPAYQVQNSDGNYISHLVYKSYEIKDGVSEIPDMPYLYAGDKKVQTLEITLEDEYLGLEAVLVYTVFEDYNIIARNVRFKNNSDNELNLKSAYSACFGIKNSDMDVVYYPGAWSRERDMARTHLEPSASIELSSVKGTSSHVINPFVLVADSKATETNGDVYSLSLIYSGNHSTHIERDEFNNVRVMQGINPFQFGWELKKGEEFVTPQCVMGYSDCGMGKISRELSNLYINNLCRSSWTKKERPILINNWEGTYFDFDEDKLVNIASMAKEAGVELFVLDDGWFGKRDDDRSSLGDWVVYEKKLPNGIRGLAEKINALGMEFGLWFEPEMVSPDSDLFRAHPDWAIQVKGRETAEGRNQYILDLSRKEVCDYVVNAICDVLGNANIKYVKWDMNRYMADMPCEGYNHKYTLGYYNIMSRITEAFPDVLFEGCSGGGGRFDAGVLAYMPQIWTSDNSDAVARLKCQHSTSMGYPVSSISAHVTAVPNHQTGRLTPLKTRADVAYAGAFGYELDFTDMSKEDFAVVKEQVSFYKNIRKFMQNGDFYRLSNIFDSNYATWETLSKDKSEAFVMCCRVMCISNFEEPKIKLLDLNPDADYRDEFTGKVYGGDYLMYYGITPEFEQCDYATFTMYLKEVK